MRRYDWLKEILRLDPERDFLRIHRITYSHEFPWDITRALELALYRTYAVPSIGRLLAETAELTDRAQKRYDDTALLLDTVIEHGFDADEGRTAIRRINQMHRSYDISNEDMRYVLCTFVAVPIRWIEKYGWRRLSEHEKRAMAAYYRTLGRHMGIRDIPQTHQEFMDCLDAYEEAHFGWDPGARRVADASLDLMAGWYGPLAPVVRGASMALLDDALLTAFRYDRPRPAVRTAVRTALKVRAKAVRLLPPRRTAHFARQNPEIKGYPNGYRIAGLGTFPAPRRGGGCPVHPVGDAPAGEGPAAS
ncbi:oxygenase MpaB family protein [Streptomyces sp. NPDC093097]|uniref:oxygenase MpaB family protein n=1 Tax=Streptomyces sp. NPDC093097 TaxID=3366027 RepID=UPI0037F9C0E5